jgi:hypothetical protein
MSVNENFVPAIETLEVERTFAQPVSFLVQLAVIHHRLRSEESLESIATQASSAVNLAYTFKNFS